MPRPKKCVKTNTSSLDSSYDPELEFPMDFSRTTNQPKRQTRATSKRSKKVNSPINSSIVVLDDSDEECLTTIISRSRIINESVTNRVDDFFKSSGLLSDDEDELPSFITKTKKCDHKTENADVNAPSSSKKEETNTTNSDSIVVIDDESNEITTREDIENYCRETEDILKSAKAILDKFTGAKTEEKPSSTESVVPKNNENEQHRGLGECPICYESFSEKQVMTTKCGHLFCKVCMERIATSVKKCPTCRKAVNKKNIISIYI